MRVCCIEPKDESRELSAELLRDKHILVCNTPPANFDDMTALELIQIASVGCERPGVFLRINITLDGRAYGAESFFPEAVAARR